MEEEECPIWKGTHTSYPTSSHTMSLEVIPVCDVRTRQMVTYYFHARKPSLGRQHGMYLMSELPGPLDTARG